MRMYLFAAVAAAALLSGQVAQAEEAVIELPAGWQVDDDHAGNGWLFSHTDGSRLLVSEIVRTDTGMLRVAWSVRYERDGMQCVDAGVRTFSLPESTDPFVMVMSVDYSLTDSSGTVTLHLPWPRHVVREFRRLIDPATRAGICTT